MQNRIQILSTRPIDPTQIKTANDLGIDIDCISFIETTAIESKDILSKIKEVLSNKATVVFTSMNAIDAVVSQLSNSKPDWAVYCMGVTSNQLIKQNFREDAVVGTATNSAELAELIIAEKRSNQIYFFCGDQRRDELPSILKNNGILVKEIKVYHTKEIKHTISKDYDGILFFSPSAVISFFNSNSLPEQSVAFAIGKTTASTLISRTNNKVVVAELPGKDKLVKKMMDHFQNH